MLLFPQRRVRTVRVVGACILVTTHQFNILSTVVSRLFFFFKQFKPQNSLDLMPWGNLEQTCSALVFRNLPRPSWSNSTHLKVSDPDINI